MITRRIFGKIAAAAPAALSAAANAGLAPPISAMAELDAGSQAAMQISGGLGYAGESFDPIKNAKRRIAELIDGRPARRGDYLRNISRLDPDLADARSLSMSARIRLQAERNEARDFERQHSWMQEELSLLLRGGKG